MDKVIIGLISISPSLHCYLKHHQTWNLAVASGKRIELTFESFDLEAHSTCGYDYVQISFGSVEEKYCVNNKPSPIISPGNTMRVTFHSDETVNMGGFRATWEAIEAGKFFGKC